MAAEARQRTPVATSPRCGKARHHASLKLKLGGDEQIGVNIIIRATEDPMALDC